MQTIKLSIIALLISTSILLMGQSKQFHHIKKINSVEIGKKQVYITGQYPKIKKTENILISFPKEDIIRINKSIDKKPVLKGDVVSFKSSDKNGIITLSTKKIRVEINKSKWNIKAFNDKNEIFWHEINKGGFDNASTMRISCESRTDEHYYGFGEKFNGIDQRGKMAPMHICDAYMTDSADNYKSIPFFISTKEYGFFVNSAMELIFNMGDEDSTQYSFNIPDTEVEYYIICNSNPLKIIEDYTAMTGRTKMIPKWTLEPWLSRRPMVGWNYDFSRPEKDIDMIIDDGYRLGVVLWEGIKSRFEKAECNTAHDLINKWHDKGLKVICWSFAGHLGKTKHNLEKYDIEKNKKYFIRKQDGSLFGKPLDGWTNEDLNKKNRAPQIFIDASNPEAMEWYCETMYGKWMKDKDGKSADGLYNFDGVKIDFCESFPVESKHLLMENYEKGMRNLHPVLFSEYVYDWLQRVKPDGGITWSRGGGLGLQKAGYVWDGDRRRTFKQNKGSIEALLSLSIAGVPLGGTDIGGYRGGDKPYAKEAYIRGVQFATFSPSFHDHGSSHAPWELDVYGRENYKYYTRVRYNLIPYLYHYLDKAVKTGEPLMRTLYLHYPKDKNTYSIEDEYLLGEALLVAPITAIENRREIYLPKGNWINLWTNSYYGGEQKIVYQAELNEIPVFVKNGSILPLDMSDDLEIGSMFPQEKKNDLLLTFNILGDKNAKLKFYDGKSYLNLSTNIKENSLTFNAENITKDFGLRILSSTPKTITVNGKTIDQVETMNFKKLSSGWWYDIKNKCILVKVKSDVKTSKYQIIVKAEDDFSKHPVIRASENKKITFSSHIDKTPVYEINSDFTILDANHYIAKMKIEENKVQYVYAVNSKEEKEHTLWVKMCKNKGHHKYARWYKMDNIKVNKGESLLSVSTEIKNIDIEKIFLSTDILKRPFIIDEEISENKFSPQIKKWLEMVNGVFIQQ